MTKRWGRTMVAVAAGAMVLLVSSCSITMMSEEQKVEELRRAGERGAEAHLVLLAEYKLPTPEECLNNYSRFTGGGAPWDEPYSATVDWISLHGEYFVDSCVTGKPRVPTK
ncbi:hypothetical protein BS329_36760 [Amycolatopsis coloradensis]|uniref:Lipoprotein n=1 Tax=Amycolatopsis coloradensis TaxID=76021 RepID=A0A1R0KG20_9PSEU|nr:hypothetical protein [Amycolatopsis coloradensis]OLZ44420.1 hypothetical protein BS329_36760 [Amycolatopsis coloradensis]